MKRIKHVMFSILDLIAEIGGFFSSCFAIFSIIGGLINRKFLFQKIMRSMYYVNILDYKQSSNASKLRQFNY